MTAAEDATVSIDLNGASPDQAVVEVAGAIEKPGPAKAPSRLGLIGRYLFTPDVFDLLEQATPGVDGEIQLTDAMLKLGAAQDIHGYLYRGRTFDCGSPEGFIEANVAFALWRPDLREAMSRVIAGLLEDIEPRRAR